MVVGNISLHLNKSTPWLQNPIHLITSFKLTRLQCSMYSFTLVGTVLSLAYIVNNYIVINHIILSTIVLSKVATTTDHRHFFLPHQLFNSWASMCHNIAWLENENVDVTFLFMHFAFVVMMEIIRLMKGPQDWVVVCAKQKRMSEIKRSKIQYWSFLCIQYLYLEVVRTYILNQTKTYKARPYSAPWVKGFHGIRVAQNVTRSI